MSLNHKFHEKISLRENIANCEYCIVGNFRREIFSERNIFRNLNETVILEIKFLNVASYLLLCCY